MRTIVDVTADRDGKAVMGQFAVFHPPHADPVAVLKAELDFSPVDLVSFDFGEPVAAQTIQIGGRLDLERNVK